MGSKNFSKCTFCPSCGVNNIERDKYRNEREVQTKHAGKAEFVCLACGFGFMLTASLRVEHGNSLFKAHRALRVGKD